MNEKRNALAELAERLDAVLPYVTVECGVNEIDPHLTSKHAKDFIVVAQRIVAELAKVQTEPYQDCVQAYYASRAIAEEGT